MQAADKHTTLTLGPLTIRRTDAPYTVSRLFDGDDREIAAIWPVDSLGEPAIEEQAAYARLFAAAPLLLRILEHAYEDARRCLACRWLVTCESGPEDHSAGCPMQQVRSILKGERA